MIHGHLIPRIDGCPPRPVLLFNQELLIQHTCLDDLIICNLFSLILPGSFRHCPRHSLLVLLMETSAGRNHFNDINTRFVSKVSYLHLNEVQYTGKLEPRIKDQKAGSWHPSQTSEFSTTMSWTNLSYFKTRLWNLAMRYCCAMAGVDPSLTENFKNNNNKITKRREKIG